LSTLFNLRTISLNHHTFKQGYIQSNHLYLPNKLYGFELKFLKITGGNHNIRVIKKLVVNNATTTLYNALESIFNRPIINIIFKNMVDSSVIINVGIIEYVAGFDIIRYANIIELK
jgi:hypothetical protein